MLARMHGGHIRFTGLAHHIFVSLIHDISLFEAIGPLILLCNYPAALRGSAWVHYIDNIAAQHALLRGSSSIASGDHAVGATWARVAARDCWP